MIQINKSLKHWYLINLNLSSHQHDYNKDEHGTEDLPCNIIMLHPYEAGESTPVCEVTADSCCPMLESQAVEDERCD